MSSENTSSSTKLIVIGVSLIVFVIIVAIVLYFVLTRNKGTPPSPSGGGGTPSGGGGTPSGGGGTPSGGGGTGSTGTSGGSTGSSGSLNLPASNLVLCYSEQINPLRSKIVQSETDQCTINKDGWINKFRIAVWSSKPTNIPLIKYNVWSNQSSNSDYILPDSNKTITSTTTGWTQGPQFYALPNDVSSNFVLEKYDVYSPTPTTQRSLVVRSKLGESITGWTYQFSFYGPRESITPRGDIYLCYAESKFFNPHRSFIFYNDSNCTGEANDWIRQFKIPVYSSGNSLTTEYTIWFAGAPDRNFITKSNSSPGSGWSAGNKFYAYSEPQTDTDRYCLMTANDPVRQIITKNNDCTRSGWSLQEVFYAPRKHMDM